jgi:hypothetical protein
MKNIYLHIGDDDLGPFEMEDLKTQKILKDTYVWFEGIDDWTKAGEIEELKPFIIPSPPPFKKPILPPPFKKSIDVIESTQVEIEEVPTIEKFDLPKNEVSNKIDIRGLGNDVIKIIDEFISEAVQCDFQKITILHGSSRLGPRDQIQNFLKTHINVSLFRDGDSSEGGFTVTIAELTKQISNTDKEKESRDRLFNLLSDNKKEEPGYKSPSNSWI